MQDLRRSNFTSANIRKANFKGSNLQGAYLMKAVAFKTNFEDANLSDVLMDRAVMNEVCAWGGGGEGRRRVFLIFLRGGRGCVRGWLRVWGVCLCWWPGQQLERSFVQSCVKHHIWLCCRAYPQIACQSTGVYSQGTQLLLPLLLLLLLLF